MGRPDFSICHHNHMRRDLWSYSFVPEHRRVNHFDIWIARLFHFRCKQRTRSNLGGLWRIVGQEPKRKCKDLRRWILFQLLSYSPIDCLNKLTQILQATHLKWEFSVSFLTFFPFWTWHVEFKTRTDDWAKHRSLINIFRKHSSDFLSYQVVIC